MSLCRFTPGAESPRSLTTVPARERVNHHRRGAGPSWRLIRTATGRTGSRSRSVWRAMSNSSRSASRSSVRGRGSHRLLHRPLRPPGQLARGETGPWPVLAVVLDEPNELAEPVVRPVFELLDDPARTDRIAVVAARCHWSVLDPEGSLLLLSVPASAPVRFDLNIVVPAQPVLGFTHLLTRGSTIAFTDQRHARRLPERVRVRNQTRAPSRDACASRIPI